MNADEIKAAYAAELQETIIVRRYTGAGTSRPKFDAQVRGKAWDETPSKELIGTIKEYNKRVLVMVDDLIAKGFAIPLTSNDKVVLRGKEIAIVVPNARKAPDGTLAVYDLQCQG